MRKILKLLFHRVAIVPFFMLLQLALLAAVLVIFTEYVSWFYTVFSIIGILFAIRIMLGNDNPSYKIAWIVPMVALPFFTLFFYLIFGASRLSKRRRSQMASLDTMMREGLKQDPEVSEHLLQSSIEAAEQSWYMEKYAHCPVYQNTETEFLPLGEDKQRCLLEEIKLAKRYIFLEYFIIQEGEMWDAVLDELHSKALDGVDVRVMYDDMGSIMLLPYNYPKKLESMGIKCLVFNRFTPILSSRFNTRDHRKLFIIDGIVGFTGGINLADEYINAYVKHGHWKDCAVMLKGDAVWSMTVMFLSMWENISGVKENLDSYRPEPLCLEPAHCPGFVQPYTDSPLDDETVGRTVYMNLLCRAIDYVYISTPYLILDAELVTMFTNIAKMGVDVRIVTPGVADKWYVHMVTRANYEALLLGGVKIYEYTPGFIHAKTLVCDDKYATVGTVNFDFRSLFLHFECGAWMYGTRCTEALKQDYLKMLEVCEPITLEKVKSTPWYTRTIGSLLKIFAPLM